MELIVFHVMNNVQNVFLILIVMNVIQQLIQMEIHYIGDLHHEKIKKEKKKEFVHQLKNQKKMENYFIIMEYQIIEYLKYKFCYYFDEYN